MTDNESNPPLPHNATRIYRRASRKVSALNSQQVQHKRDLDRKAQRALRQRVKSRMQDLEEDLTRAKADCSVREQQLLEELQQLRDENRNLRSYLDSIGQFALGGATEATEAVDPNASASPGLIAGDDEPVLETEDQPQGPNSEAIVDAPNRSDCGRLSSAYQNQRGPLDLPPLDISASLARGERHGMIPAHSLLTSTWTTQLNTPQYLPLPSSMGIASVLPKHTTAKCPLDQILLDFTVSRRAVMAKGGDIDSILGSPQSSLHAILHPGSPTPGGNTTSQVLAEILTLFPHVAIPQRLAFIFIMYRTMRWQISPTEANYEQMPRWLRPTATQITVPHSPWIDNIPWPRVRDLLIESPEKYPFAVFSEPYSQNVTVNWPYEDMDCVSTTADGAEFNPIFEKHVRKLDNWTVSPSFNNYFPEVMPAIYERH
ncbi:hypothetical protein BJX99DRAFT_163416 [Aspergillus californicus]